MRTMKFKAWDKARECWIDDCDLLMTPNGSVYAGDVNNPPMVFIEPENVVFFTGLHDKNGTPIYEGDIVEEWIYPSETKNGRTRFLIHNGKVSNKGAVQYNEKEACFRPKGIKGFWYMNLNEIEVIGNAFEHSHLLEQTT